MNDRVRTAAWAVPLFLGVLLWGGLTGFALLVALVAGVGTAEYRRIVGGEGNALESGFVAVWGGVVALGFLSPYPEVPGALVVLGSLVLLTGWMVGPGPREDLLPRWGAVVGGWIWVAFFLGHAVWIRRWGLSPVLFVVAVVWAGDTAAYYVGSAVGEHPLAPRVSPKKSMEGAVASLVAAGGAAGLFWAVLPLPHGFGASLVLGIGLNLVAQLGDLVESFLKRGAGVKDSGTLFPGHGGVLDRVDAFLPVLPLYAVVLSMVGAG